jgi:hypothetical protein
MKVVIACAARKAPGAGQLRNAAGDPVRFVACPPSARDGVRPDDTSDEPGTSWRFVLGEYNAQFLQTGENPDNLLPAGRLYRHPVYARINEAFGVADVYILSAGWGLVRSAYLLPSYDITFSRQGTDPVARRHPDDLDAWHDFNHLAEDVVSEDGEIHAFVGRDYLPLLYRLAGAVPGRKVIHHKAATPSRTGYEYVAFESRRNQNWHYDAATAFARTDPR